MSIVSDINFHKMILFISEAGIFEKLRLSKFLAFSKKVYQNRLVLGILIFETINTLKIACQFIHITKLEVVAGVLKHRRHEDSRKVISCMRACLMKGVRLGVNVTLTGGYHGWVIVRMSL